MVAGEKKIGSVPERRPPEEERGAAVPQSALDALEALEALEKIRSILSHDLRSPLTVMISYAGTVGKGRVGDLSERQSEMLDLVVEQGFKLDKMIAELVRIARETLKRYNYPPTPDMKSQS